MKYKADDIVKINSQGLLYGKVIFSTIKDKEWHYFLACKLPPLPNGDEDRSLCCNWSNRYKIWSDHFGVDLSSLDWKSFVGHLMLDLKESEILGKEN